MGTKIDNQVVLIERLHEAHRAAIETIKKLIIEHWTEKYDLRKGDFVINDTGRRYAFERFDFHGEFYMRTYTESHRKSDMNNRPRIITRKIKKDGKPYASTTMSYVWNKE